jgi:putative membrane protein insertion efficiency factor
MAGTSASASASSDSGEVTGARRAAGPILRAATVALLALGLAARARAGESESGRSAPDDAATGAIRVYQHYLSDLRHARCRFTPSCSEYAAQAIARYGLIDGSARAADRLMRCNASAVGAYPSGEGGTLRDPVGDEPAPAGVIWAPGWLRLGPEPEMPPVADTVGADRRVRLGETVAFARRLEQRGERASAATEYQRAAMLAGLARADAWAFDRIGAGAARAADALGAEAAYLTAAMLSPDEAQRAREVYRAATSRFDGGSFAACERLLADRTLVAPAPESSGVRREGRPDAAHVEALGGLANLGLGDWDVARARFASAHTLAALASPAPDDTTRRRIETLAGFVEQGPRLPRRSPVLAGTISAVLPGSGQLYSGRGSDGLRHLLFNAAMILTTISFARGEHVPAAILTGSLALPFYIGNIRGAADSAKRFNRERRLELLGRAIDRSAR